MTRLQRSALFALLGFTAGVFGGTHMVFVVAVVAVALAVLVVLVTGLFRH